MPKDKKKTSDTIFYTENIAKAYRDIKNHYAYLFTSDDIPPLDVRINSGSMKKTPLFGALRTEILTHEIDGVIKVLKVQPFEIKIDVPVIQFFMEELGFIEELKPWQYDNVIYSFMRQLILYQLVIIHSIQNDYNSFKGEDGTMSKKELMKVVHAQEATGFYNNRLEDFYAHKIPEDDIADAFITINGKLISHMRDYGTIENVAKNRGITKCAKTIIKLFK